MVAASSSSSKDDLSLGADQEEAPALTCDAASCCAVSQRRGSVPSQRNQFTCKYESGDGNQNRQINGSVTTHTGGSILFASYAKRMGSSLGREQSPVELFVETHMWSEDRQKGVQQEQQGLIQFLTALRSDFEGLRGSILHRSPLPSVDSVVSELLAEEIRLQSYSEKGILSASNPSVLAVPSKPFSNHQNKPYTRVGFDECSFCKQKGHWKAQCPKLRQQNQAWKSGNPSQSNAHRPPQGYKPQHHNIAAVASPGSITDPNILAEQFQKFLSLQPQVMSASSSIGQLPHSSSGSAVSEADWDRP
ncbi:uncharacterized protein LOC133705519 [Populus nigra]|uniref:uncharacterized protein LOC133705519 n=1 Tax=Populus nigra TaxID=3691 RepID=UPI002B26A9E9|nr:uncharacterized protein LOC133705519 [Populus nigra]